MTTIRQRMQEDLELRRYAASTVRAYLDCARKMTEHFMRPPGRLGIEDLRGFLLHLVKVKKIGPARHKMFIAALKFLYGVTLGRGDIAAAIAYPRVQSKLPDVLSTDEVALLLCHIDSQAHRMVITATYALGLRIGEACRLSIPDLDTKRMVIHIKEAKRGRDRFVMLPESLLLALRHYWAHVRPQGAYLFPGRDCDEPQSPDPIRRSLRLAAHKAGLTKKVTPHVLRHSFATHLLESGTDIRIIQAILGHVSIRATARYTRVSRHLIAGVKSPYESISAR